MLTYDSPAKAFCERYHEHYKHSGFCNYIAPHNARTQRALTVLTSVSSICVQRAGDDVAAALFLDVQDQQKPTMIVAGNPTITTEARGFLPRLFGRLRDWAQGGQLAHAVTHDNALIDIASLILAFQAKRWMLRLHDNPDDRATLKARLAKIRDEIGPTRFAAIQDVMDAVERITRQARTVLSGTDLRTEDVEGLVRTLLEFEQLVCLRASQSALRLRDKHIIGYRASIQLFDTSRNLAIGDLNKLEDHRGQLIPEFSLIHYVVNILAVVRFARHLVDFACKEGAFLASQSVTFEFCDDHDALGQSGTPPLEKLPATDRAHAAMRVLQAILERADMDNVRFLPTIGSSTSLCGACYDGLSNLDTVNDLPKRTPVPIYGVGPRSED